MDHLSNLPEDFLKRLTQIIPPHLIDDAVSTFSSLPYASYRINTLKISAQDLKSELLNKGIEFRSVPWIEEAVIVSNESQERLKGFSYIDEGKLYKQNLSSLLPVVILNPQPNETILDACAAPGSKTSHMASVMKNEGTLMAVESVRQRFYKLKAVSDLLGIGNAEFFCTDIRRYKPAKRFDKILVDAPCSTEGRFSVNDKKSYQYWSTRKIKEMAHKQKGILLHTSRLLKPKGSLVYSTCTFAPEENEEVLNWFLKKAEGKWKILPIKLHETIAVYPAILNWNEKTYNSALELCVRVLPSKGMEGFFIAHLYKES